MEMCYDGALVMPSSYAVMSEEEMMYVEGGYTFSMKVDYVERIIDVAAIVISAGLSSSATVGKIAVKIGWKKLKKKLKKALIKIGVSKKFAGKAVDILKTATGFSLGWAAAQCLDRVDRSGKNGWVQF